MEHVPGELVKVAVRLIELIVLPAVKGGLGLETRIVLRDHIRDKDLRIMIIVDIGHVGPHGGRRDTPHHIHQVLFKGAVMIVQIEVIPLKEIIGDIDIHPPVLVDIADGDPQTETDDAAEDPCLLAHIGKMPAVIAKKLVSSY